VNPEQDVKRLIHYSQKEETRDPQFEGSGFFYWSDSAKAWMAFRIADVDFPGR
jgi:hypothetical protein